MTSFARAERPALCDTLEAVGPDAPTLDAGWAARDLAAHLVLRESRPDAAPGILLTLLGGWTDRVQRSLARRPWPELVQQLRDGPPRWSPFALPALEEKAGLVELFVHHEDVRRAQPGWEPRVLGQGLDDALWERLRPMARMLYRKAPATVVLRRDGGGEARAGRGGDAQVVVAGPAQELLLHAFGRGTHARVRVEGDPDVVARVAERLGV